MGEIPSGTVTIITPNRYPHRPANHPNQEPEAWNPHQKTSDPNLMALTHKLGSAMLLGILPIIGETTYNKCLTLC
ncbi:Hypothetical protein CINCED_3A014831 [Cinara cedri]|uniref:Uncharacterized protein n=1 Tax=Cinara cedri TaxID=506608 RepID=A0A5E4M489_9HEMI|nr:Hypothetical protein CINCED_3A014831 [Cinara cedri]